MTTRATRGWCHELVTLLTSPQPCPSCGHDADRPRLDCSCPSCRSPRVGAARGPWPPGDVEPNGPDEPTVVTA
jgi:hypothetical protein